ncbi:MAG: PQQ-binding-like beta-propeller repeat protein [Planctomycetia bacterium]|nr:PQQ-binding-like beta-propeller repeat protein [Planctomycetia bacterium]
MLTFARFTWSACSLGLLLAALGNGQPPAKAPASGPTFEQLYGGYHPDFLDKQRLSRNEPLKLSLQPWFFNMSQVEHDYRVDAFLKKADELFAAKDYRGAMKLYHEVISSFPGDLWRIQPDGIFIPSALYAQRQLLRMPKEQLLYYRTLHDAEAQQLYERAKKYYSPLDFAEVTERYLATSYGPRALWELGNMALDQGQYAKALFYYQEIRDYCTLHDLPETELALRLAACYKHLGRVKEYEVTRPEAARSESASGLLKALDSVKTTTPPYFRQSRHPEFIALGDYDLFPDLQVPVGRREFVWSEANPQSQREWYVRALPWIAGNSICYLHHNVLFCRSLLSGKLNWTFGPGGLLDSFDVPNLQSSSGTLRYHPESDLLLHDGLVFASIVKEGPSLVAVDQTTGQLRWAKGAFAATSDSERNTRYLAAPAPGPNVVYAPYVLDDLAGTSHLSSRAGMQCLDSRTGRLIWSREICQLTPAQFSISSRVRRIRIFGSQPTLKDGVLYHYTNAGVVTALDALSGRILWATRYPIDPDANDLLRGVERQLWFSRPPLVWEGRVYVTPADCGLLLCLDAATGKVVWSAGRRPSGEGSQLGDAHTLVGLNTAGELVVAGSGLLALEPRTGKTLWTRPATPADTRERIGGAGSIRCRPLLTRSNKVYFNGSAWTGTHCEQFWDMTAKKTAAERWYYDIGHTRTLTNYNGKVEDAARKAGKEVNPADLVHNVTDPFTTYHRMTFERHGTVFELEISPQAVSLWYDREQVASAVGKDASPQGLFRLAELKEMQGDRKKAVELFEQALAALPAQPTPFRTEINRQLFRLYRHQAGSALRTGDLAGADGYCERMALACTTSQDEIYTILALAEIAQRQGRWAEAAAALTGAIKHYGSIKFAVPAVLAGDTQALRTKGLAVIANMQGKSPPNYYSKELELAVKVSGATLENYFSILSPLEPDMEVQTGPFAGEWLQRLLAKAPEDFRKQYEAAADDVFRAQTEEATVLRLLGEYPRTQAAQQALDRLIEQAGKLAEPARRIALWRLNDAGRTNGLKVPEAVQQACNIRVAEVATVALGTSYRQQTTALGYDANTLLMVLQPADGLAAKEDLAFLGMRSKRLNANKFGLICWGPASNQKKWEVAEIRLKDKGEEEGFQKFFIHQGKVIVHGWYDVLAFALADGQLAWRAQVPHGFRILDSAAAEDVLVLTDNSRTLALHLANGQLIWDANETGGAYSPPIVRDNLLATVRRNPSGVSFRDLGTGRLLSLLPLPGLSEATGNPAVKWDDPGASMVQTKDSLVVTDGWDYIAVDLPSRSIRWQKRITNIDRGGVGEGTQAAGFRFWANDATVVVLKPNYDTVGLEALGLADGELRWHINEAKTPGVLHNLALGTNALYGLHYSRDDPSTLNLLGYQLADGKSLYKQVRRGLTKPETWLPGPLRGHHFLVHYSDEQKRDLLIVEAATGKVTQQLDVKGFGQWGQYGQVSYAVQGPAVIVLSDKELTVANPQK